MRSLPVAEILCSFFIRNLEMTEIETPSNPWNYACWFMFYRTPTQSLRMFLTYSLISFCSLSIAPSKNDNINAGSTVLK